ncbi:AIPR family protein [Bifidobacterium eulemuris]|uniref:AIPR family protein n=3 Tax=Bifidobacterium eulemuris TaxID=1765219 RepID=A0A7L9SPL5_9BIFI|nr:AIPR family protein [Bifidobacterium eulemuris]QOL32298.1 AIPR family protein [Bifidobacterium eulemuris]
MKSKYEILLSVLDDLCDQAPSENKKYHPCKPEEYPKARSLAYIHLLLKARFGIQTFEDREKCITDGTQDGGIDAYYISHEERVIYLIQSKFRNTEKNFDGGKDISYEDLASMSIREIIAPKSDGPKFNGKIQKMQSALSLIKNPQLYEYKVIILANLKESHSNKSKEVIGRLLQNFDYEIIDYKKTYDELLLPSIMGTCSRPSEIQVPLSLEDKDHRPQATNRIKTSAGNCRMSILFVSTLEIAKMMHQYKNALLKYNPRSFLGLRNKSINTAIKQTIINSSTNEFALYNNGITIVTSQSDFHENYGVVDQATLTLVNPQIINGGQTAATLAEIYNSEEKSKLEDKEVLVRIITFDGHNDNYDRVIRELSKATNGQTPVKEEDRHANDPLQEFFKRQIFADYGLLYEHKIGEFHEGLKHKFVDNSQKINRTDFLKLSIAINGDVASTRSTANSKLFSQRFFENEQNASEETLRQNCRRYMFGYFVLQRMKNLSKKNKNEETYGNAVRYGKYAVVKVCDQFYPFNLPPENTAEKAEAVCDMVLSHWSEFEDSVLTKHTKTENERIRFDFDNYYKNQMLNEDLETIDISWQADNELAEQ